MGVGCQERTGWGDLCVCVCVHRLCMYVCAHPRVYVRVQRRSGQRKRIGKRAQSLWLCQLKQTSNAMAI